MMFNLGAPPESAYGLLAKSAGAGIGSGYQQGITQNLNQMLEMKQRTQSAQGYANLLGLKGDAKTNFLNGMVNIPTQYQMQALQELRARDKQQQDALRLKTLQDLEFGGGGGTGTQVPGSPQNQPGIPVAQPRQPQAMEEPGSQAAAPQANIEPPTSKAPKPVIVKGSEEKPLPYTEAAIQKAGLLNPAAATRMRRANEAVQKQNVDIAKRADQRFVKDRDYALKLTKPTMTRIEEIRNNIPVVKQSLRFLDNAIQNNDKNKIWDVLADITRIESLRSSEGATMKTAGKEFFMSNLARAGARPNIFLEQQIADMGVKVGRSKEANLSTKELLQSEADIREKEVEIFDKLSAEDEAQYGFVKPDIGKRIHAELAPYAQKRQNQLAYRIEELREEQDGPQSLQKITKVVPGTPLTEAKAQVLVKQMNGDTEAAIKLAKQMGYTFYDPSTGEEQ